MDKKRSSKLLKWPVRMISGFVHAPVSLPSIRIRSEIFGNSEQGRNEAKKIRESEREKRIDLSVFNATTRFFAAPTTGNRDTRDSLVKRETRENILPLSLYSPECLHSRMGVGYDRMDDRRGKKLRGRRKEKKASVGGRV